MDKGKIPLLTKIIMLTKGCLKSFVGINRIMLFMILLIYSLQVSHN